MPLRPRPLLPPQQVLFLLTVHIACLILNIFILQVLVAHIELRLTVLPLSFDQLIILQTLSAALFD